MSCDTLTVFYNPESAKIASTNLSSFTSDSIKRNIDQKYFKLYNKEGNFVGNLNILNNECIYEQTPTITNTIANYCFTINNNTFIEKYSVVNENEDEKNSSGFVISNLIRYLNLQSSEGTQQYTKLKWILPADKEGNPLTRTLIFYN